MGGSIVLIGFMGAGKSTVGRLLADRLGFTFVDTDRIAEDLADGRSVAEIWRAEGEEGFRAFEQQAIQRAVTEPGRVIATGGGAILTAANRKRLRDAGAIVHLRVDADEVRRRVKRSAGRPLLAGRSRAEADELLEERERHYMRSADLTIDTTGRSPDEVVDQIIEGLR